MKVGLLVADHTGCGMYRMLLPGAVARGLGIHVDFLGQIDARVENGVVQHVPKTPYDVLVYQRPLNRLLVDTIPFVQAHGTRVVVELDDDLENTHPANQAYRAVAPRFNVDMNWHHLRRAVNMADLVTVSTDALKERYGGDKAVVVPNFVPKRMLDVKPPRMERQDGAGELDEQTRIGWAGQIASHPHDLQVTCGAVNEVMARTAAAFRVIGDPAGVPPALRLQGGAFEATGWVDINQYPLALSTLDVGIVPLDDTPFNRAKSWLKGLEYAVLGVPFVASPLPEYTKLHDLGIGDLAGSRTEWVEHLEHLVTDVGYRSSQAQHAREVVRDTPLTIEGNGHRWVAAWEQATKKLIVVGGR